MRARKRDDWINELCSALRRLARERPALARLLGWMILDALERGR